MRRGLWLLLLPFVAAALEVELSEEAVKLAAIEVRPLPPSEFPPARRFLAVVLDPLPRIEKQIELRRLQKEASLLERELKLLEARFLRLKPLDAVSAREKLKIEREILNLKRDLLKIERREKILSEQLLHRYGSPPESASAENTPILQVAVSRPLPLWLDLKTPLKPLAPAHHRHPRLPQPGYLYRAPVDLPLPYDTPLWVFQRRREQAYLLPAEAVVFYSGQRWIFRQAARETFRLQAVEIVEEEGNRVWVQAPLPGEGGVVVRGAPFLLGELLKALIPSEEGEEE